MGGSSQVLYAAMIGNGHPGGTLPLGFEFINGL
jgi:hypothetical protein